MEHIKKNRFFLIILGLLLLPSQVSSKSQEAEINNLHLTKTNKGLFLSFTVLNAFSEDISKLILSGIPVTFSFDIKIKKERSFFPDKTILEKEIIHKMKYSSLTKAYFIIKPYSSEEPYIIHSEKLAKSEMASVTDLDLHLSGLAKGEKYQIKTRARLREVTLPFYLHKIFFFLSVWDFKTDWQAIDIEF